MMPLLEALRCLTGFTYSTQPGPIPPAQLNLVQFHQTPFNLTYSTKLGVCPTEIRHERDTVPASWSSCRSELLPGRKAIFLGKFLVFRDYNIR